MPMAVIAGFVAAYYTPGARPAIAEFGRYAFPAIGADRAARRRRAARASAGAAMLSAGVVLLVAMIALSYASQLLTLTCASMPDVSVAIPVRDGGALLARACCARSRARRSRTSCSSATRARATARASSRARTARACSRSPPAQLQPRRHAQPADARGRAARTWRSSPRTPSRRTSAGSSACWGASRWPTTWRSSTAPTGRAPDASPAVRIELRAAGSARSRPTAPPQRRAPGRAASGDAAGDRADRPARLLHRRQRVRRARGLASGCRSARSPTPRTGCSRSTCCAPATPRRSCPQAAVLHSHAYTPAAAAAPLLRRVARAARGLRLARARLAAAPAARGCAARSGARARELRRDGARAARAPATLAAVAAPPARAPRGRAARLARRPAAARALRRRLSLEGATPSFDAARGPRARSTRVTERPHSDAPPTQRSSDRRAPLEGRPQRPVREPAPAHLPDLHATSAAHAAVPRSSPSRCASRRWSAACGCARTRATRSCAGARALVSRARPAGRHRDPELPRRRARARRSCASIRKTVPRGHGARDRRRRLQRRRARRGAARDRRASTCSSRPSATAASPPTSTAGCARATAERDVVVLNSDVEALPSWLACLQYARLRARGRCGDRRRRSCCTPTGASSSAAPCATATRPSGSTTATASSRPTGARPDAPSPALAVTGACMYVRREAIERVGAVRRALPDGLRGRRLVPARLAGGLPRALLPRRAQLVHHESVTRGTEVGERERESQRAVLGALGGLLRRAPTCARRRDGRAADRLRDRGHRRRRRAPRHLRAPQPAADARPRGRAVHARRAARLVRRCARRCTASRTTTSSARRSRERRRDQGRDLVDDGGAGLAGERPARHPRVLRAGHRDLLLPRRRARAPRGARLLPPGVPLHDDLLVEPRAPARARASTPS